MLLLRSKGNRSLPLSVLPSVYRLHRSVLQTVFCFPGSVPQTMYRGIQGKLTRGRDNSCNESVMMAVLERGNQQRISCAHKSSRLVTAQHSSRQKAVWCGSWVGCNLSSCKVVRSCLLLMTRCSSSRKQNRLMIVLPSSSSKQQSLELCVGALVPWRFPVRQLQPRCPPLLHSVQHTHQQLHSVQHTHRQLYSVRHTHRQLHSSCTRLPLYLMYPP